MRITSERKFSKIDHIQPCNTALFRCVICFVNIHKVSVRHLEIVIIKFSFSSEASAQKVYKNSIYLHRDIKL